MPRVVLYDSEDNDGFPPRGLPELCTSHGIQVNSYSPLGAPDVERPGGTDGPYGRVGWNSSIMCLDDYILQLWKFINVYLSLSLSPSLSM